MCFAIWISVFFKTTTFIGRYWYPFNSVLTNYALYGRKKKLYAGNE